METVIFAIIGSLVGLAISAIAMWFYVKGLMSKVAALWNRIDRLEEIVYMVEHRTSFYAPTASSGDFGTSGASVQQRLGFSEKKNYVGMDIIVEMILKKLGLSIRRSTPPPEEVYLVDGKAKGSTGEAK